jgi:orotidine-5'-phosphate decarboxylase
MSRTAGLAPRDRLSVALDLPSVREAEALIALLGDSVGFYKIGYQLAFERGLPLAAAIAAAGKNVFLDMKLHDIANTVARGVENVARMGVRFLTVHAYPQTMRAAVEAKAGSQLELLAVTVLTSYDDTDVAEAGYSVDVEHLVAERSAQAHNIGIDGIVCSAEEAAPLRLIIGPDMLLVAPGIRPAGSQRDDQKRVATPASAIAASVDYIVVGRPIVAAPDPRAAVESIVDEIAHVRRI